MYVKMALARCVVAIIQREIVCICVRMSMYMYVCIYMHARTCMYVCMYVCVPAPSYWHIYMHTVHRWIEHVHIYMHTVHRWIEHVHIYMHTVHRWIEHVHVHGSQDISSAVSIKYIPQYMYTYMRIY